MLLGPDPRRPPSPSSWKVVRQAAGGGERNPDWPPSRFLPRGLPLVRGNPRNVSAPLKARGSSLRQPLHSGRPLRAHPGELSQPQPPNPRRPPRASPALHPIAAPLSPAPAAASASAQVRSPGRPPPKSAAPARHLELPGFSASGTPDLNTFCLPRAVAPSLWGSSCGRAPEPSSPALGFRVTLQDTPRVSSFPQVLSVL